MVFGSSIHTLAATRLFRGITVGDRLTVRRIRPVLTIRTHGRQVVTMVLVGVQVAADPLRQVDRVATVATPIQAVAAVLRPVRCPQVAVTAAEMADRLQRRLRSGASIPIRAGQCLERAWSQEDLSFGAVP